MIIHSFESLILPLICLNIICLKTVKIHKKNSWAWLTIVINNSDYNIDQNNCDYHFDHNRDSPKLSQYLCLDTTIQ